LTFLLLFSSFVIFEAKNALQIRNSWLVGQTQVEHSEVSAPFITKGFQMVFHVSHIDGLGNLNITNLWSQADKWFVLLDKMITGIRIPSAQSIVN